MPQMNLRDSEIWVGGLTGGIKIEVGDGTLTYVENRPLKYVTEGNVLADVVEDDEKPLELKFDFVWKRASATHAAILARIKGATGLTSSDAAAPCRPYAVDIVVRFITACAEFMSATSITSSTTTATVTTPTAHKLKTGDTTIIKGATQNEYNGTYIVTRVSDTVFEYTFAGSATSPATGAISILSGVVARQIEFPDFRYTQLDHDMKAGKISVSGACNVLEAGAATII